MKHRLHLIGLLLITCLGLIPETYAQADKIKQAIDDQNPKRALKLAEDSEADPEFRKDPEIYFLKAKVIYELLKDEFWLKKNPEATDIAVKSIQKGKSKAGDAVLSGYDDVVAKFVELNNVSAYADFKINKYSKAYRTYMTSYELNGDKRSYFEAGRSSLYNLDTALGESHYFRVIDWVNEAHMDGRAAEKELSEAHLYFINKYWVKERYDSANYYLEQARKIYGASEKLDFFQKEVAKQQIAELPPSSLMMEIIQKNLTYFPTDTFFIRKENALYLYQIRQAVGRNDLASADSMINGITASKVFRSGSKHAAFYKEHDPFIGSEPDHVYWALAGYFNEHDHNQASNYLAYRYVVATVDQKTPEAMQNRWTVIIDYAAKSKSLSFAEQLLTYARTQFPQSPSWDALESSLLAKYSGKDLKTADQGARYRMMLRESKRKAVALTDAQTELCDKYIDQLIREKAYTLAETRIAEMSTLQPDNPLWERKKIYLAKEDFYYSYYMTRVVDEQVAGMKVNGFEWNGTPVQCNPGKVDAAILQKVENRINYFRRNAGVPAIYLDPELNDWCQKTALMMHANNVLNHEPNSKWSCYTDEGAHAARYALLTKGANTSTAVTAFMADNKNPSVGNRRWMLFPNGKAFGFGCTDTYSALWALDDSGNVDSSRYTERFVAWPPEGYLPKMMAFRFWSFSLYDNLKGAQVKMLENGQEIPLKIQDYVEGYGMPALVWEPQTDFSSTSKDRTIHVIVDLPNGRRYEYDVSILNFDAVGY